MLAGKSCFFVCWFCCCCSHILAPAVDDVAVAGGVAWAAALVRYLQYEQTQLEAYDNNLARKELEDAKHGGSEPDGIDGDGELLGACVPVPVPPGPGPSPGPADFIQADEPARFGGEEEAGSCCWLWQLLIQTMIMCFGMMRQCIADWLFDFGSG